MFHAEGQDGEGADLELFHGPDRVEAVSLQATGFQGSPACVNIYPEAGKISSRLTVILVFVGDKRPRNP